MTAPLIGLSTRRWPLAMLGAAIPAAYEDGFFDMGISYYPAAVAAAGGVAVHLSRDADLGFLLDHLDGLIMTGGADVSPARYGSPHPELVGPTEPERDAWEEALYRGAVDRDIPVLGICRGFQLINVINGGSLVEDVARDEGDGHPRFDRDRHEHGHEVRTVAGTLASELYGDSVSVNSLHHQIVRAVAEGLTVSGRAPDGSVEILELPGKEVFCVQWHPESLDHDPALTWLVSAAARFAAS